MLENSHFSPTRVYRLKEPALTARRGVFLPFTASIYVSHRQDIQLISQDSPELTSVKQAKTQPPRSGLTLTAGRCAIQYRARREGLYRSDIPEFPSPGTPHRADAGCQGWRQGKRKKEINIKRKSSLPATSKTCCSEGSS